MRAPTLVLVTVTALAFVASVNAAQYTGDKKQDPSAKKEPEKITADTLINGKTLDEWIALVSGSDRSMTELAVDSIYRYGPELAQRGVPAMIAELNKHKPQLPIDLSVRVNIPPRLSVILATLPNPDPKMVTDAVTAMRRMLDDPQIVVKFRVAQSLAQMGPLAKEARPELIKVVRDTNSPTWETRHAAVMALGAASFDPNPQSQPHQPTVDALYFALGDAAYKVRLAALQALELMRVEQFPAYRAAFQARMQKVASEDLHPSCRLRAHAAICSLLVGSEKRKRIDAVAKFLEHTDPMVRMDAAQALGQIGEDARDQLPRLLNGLRDKDAEVKKWCAWSLGCVRDRAALSQLQEIISDKSAAPALREIAQDAVNAINGGSPSKKDDPKKRGNLR